MDLIELRWHNGQLEYRSRLTVECYCREAGEYWNGPPHLVLSEWGPWRKVDGVKGDDSDRQFD